MFRRITLLSLTVAIVAMAILFTAGCDGGNDAAAGLVVMVVIPSYGGVVANCIYGDHFSGPAGKYSFAVRSAVLLARGDPTMPPRDVEYGFIVAQLTSFEDGHPGSFIRSVAPDSTGLYDLSPPGSYMVTAGEIGEFDFTAVAECWILTYSPPPSQ